MIGTEYVARSAPDGNTLTLGSISPLNLSPQVYTNTSYDTRLDFIGINSVAMTPQVIVASPKLPVQSLTDLVELAKKKPGTLNIASSGTGSNSHVAIELFKLTAAINVSHVPYKGTAPALMDVIGGQVDGAFGDLPGALSQINTGKMKVLAVTSEQRHPLLPNVATTTEQGFSELLAVNWFAVMAPAKTPSSIVNKLHAALTQAIATPAINERFRTLGLEAMPSASPDAFKAFLQSEYTRWGSVIQAASIRLE
jgi:tripartite-type tricarboxylate transporter receptor subunit TctC